MLGHVEHIEQDIAAIEAKTTAIAKDFSSQYEDYLTELRRAVRHQVGALCHYLCTQVHPESFLKLTFDQRRELLSQIQQLTQFADRQLTLPQLLAPKDSPDSRESESNRPQQATASVANQILDPKLSDPAPIADDLLVDELDYEDLDDYEDLVNEFAPPAEPRIELRLDQVPTLPETARDFADLRLDTPAGQLHWQESLDHNIVQVLRSLSQSATKLLDDTNILSSPLPDVIGSSNDPSETTEIVSNPPNLVSLVMESKGRDKARKPESRVQIVAIYLRLSDLEFQDTSLMARRNVLRGTQQHLQTLAQTYSKRLRDRSIAQAEALWQANWPIAPATES